MDALSFYHEKNGHPIGHPLLLSMLLSLFPFPIGNTHLSLQSPLPAIPAGQPQES